MIKQKGTQPVDRSTHKTERPELNIKLLKTLHDKS